MSGTYKPQCKLFGQNGNVYNLIAIADQALKHANLKEKSKEMTNKVFKAHSYEEALSVIAEYVEIV